MNITKSIDLGLIKSNKTIADLSAEIGVSKSYLYKVRSNSKMSTDRLQVIAQALGMKVSDFIALGE